ncbi:MAG TPA: UDP-N-acetylmuramoyl-tripeptide--D-alanyl-D-alanine ligase [Terriglobia bacterium]|nr:UDP-N-acetylmuramoyl-tripeptide--D-alanyl-D-alanine ligase [Terriglobia bacterium]
MELGEVAAALGASFGALEGRERVVRSYSLDSRALAPGALFFAIRGPRFDGHDFVAAALARGAVGAVVRRGFYERAGADSQPSLIPVEDTTLALQQLAQAVRRKWARKIVAVTGSTGKTTTKELIAAILSARSNVHKSSGNLNNHWGVPLTLLALELAHDVAVIEMGMSAAGEISRLAEITEPEIGVVTNVAPVHLEFFESLDAIARAKRELIENLKEPGTAVLNYDDPRVRRFADAFRGRVVTFGFREGADFRAVDVQARGSLTPNEVGSVFRLESAPYQGEFYLPLPGRHNVENALAAIAAVSLFQVDARDAYSALGNFKPLHQRTEILLANHAVVINDSYNSNPRALDQMLDTLAAWPGARRRIAVLGEMLELGPSSPEWHRSLGRKCASSKVDWLVAVQGDARFFLEGAVEAGFRAGRTMFLEDAEQAAVVCRELIQPEDVLLVKGSRGVHLERVVDALQSSQVILRA